MYVDLSRKALQGVITTGGREKIEALILEMTENSRPMCEQERAERNKPESQEDEDKEMRDDE